MNNNLYNEIINRKEKISLVGLGYVGMPIAVSFSKKVDVIGFDLNEAKIDLYKSGIDPTKEVGDEAVAACTVDFTSDETRLREAKFHIVAVPTPVNTDHTPDLSPVIGASTTLGRNLTRGSIVVYESTVYPGVTEELCVPILERESGLKCGVDFKIGYSPERITPRCLTPTYLYTVVRDRSSRLDIWLTLKCMSFRFWMSKYIFHPSTMFISSSSAMINAV